MKHGKLCRPSLCLALAPASTGLLLAAASFGHGSVRGAAGASVQPVMPATVKSFIRQNCFACHNKTTLSGGLNLAAIPFRPADANNLDFWVKVYDRVDHAEMPPKSFPQPPAASKKAFLAALSQPLTSIQVAQARREGRAVWRRLNRYEYENTLRDLLGAPWLQIRDMLPEDGLAFRFNKVGAALDVSHVQMARYLGAAEYALREATVTRAGRPGSA